MEEYRTLFGLWAFFGYFVITAMGKPTRKIQALWHLVLGGPICWIIFIFCSVNILDKKLRSK